MVLHPAEPTHSLQPCVLQKDFYVNCHSKGYSEKYFVCLKVLQKSFLLLDFSAWLQGLSHSSRAGSLISAVASSCDCSGCCEQMQTIPRVITEGKKSCGGTS